MINIDDMIVSRTLPISFTIEYDNGKTKNIHLELKSMKIKALRKLAKLEKNEDDESVLKMVRLILDNNTKNYRMKESDIDELKTEQLYAIANAYMAWIKGNQKN